MMRRSLPEARFDLPATAGRPDRLSTNAREQDYISGTAPAAQDDLAEAQADRRLADRLLALPRCERQHTIESDQQYHRLSLARLFVLAAEEALLFKRCADPEPAAELAVAIVVQLPGDARGKTRQTAALAHWLMGKALLRSGSPRRAAQAFETMFAFIPDQAPSAERGLAYHGFAQLYADAESHDAAIGMGTLAARTFSQLDAVAPTAACHAQLGLLLQAHGGLEQASGEIIRALRFLGGRPALAPSLTARLLLALAWIDATLGKAAAARQRLRSARRLYQLAPFSPESVEREWREAQATAAMGGLDEAEAQLDQVRRLLLSVGSPAEAANVTLDLAQLRIGAGRVETVEELAAALGGAFPGNGETWAIDIAGLARLTGDTRSAERFRAGQQLRRRLRRAAPPPTAQRTPLITPWRTLTDRLLRGHAEAADPSRAPGGC